MVGTPEPWSFGEQPLDDQIELARLLREVIGSVLSIECSSERLTELAVALRRANDGLLGDLPADPTPRVGPDAEDGQRVYIDHSRNIGSFNPCFPVYEINCADDKAEGFVEFPLAYEGPPGLVHGGFLAVFFDSVMQHLNCDLGLTGKTSELSVTYRRPTPLLTRLSVGASRTVTEDRILSEARLTLGEKVLCEAQMTSAIGNRANLPAVSPRREP